MQLENICDVFSGYAFKSFNTEKEGTPIIKIGNINNDGTIDLHNCQYSTEEPNKKFKSKNGDIYIALSGATTGKLGLMKSDNYYINQRVGIVRIKDLKVPVDYLLFFLRSKTKKILSDAAGAAQPNISPKDIAKYEISIPNEEKMASISKELNLISRSIVLKRNKLLSLDELIKSRFNEMFGDVDSNTHAYPSFKIGTQFSLGAGGTPSTQNKEYWDKGTISWIGSNMCQNVILYENDGKYITEKGYANSSAKLFYPDTVLVALVGATIGKVALLKFETTTNQNVLGMWDIKKNGYNPYYVYYYMQAIYGKFKAIGDGNFKMASKSFVSNLDILKPSLEKQNDFAYFVEQIDKLKFVCYSKYFL